MDAMELLIAVEVIRYDLINSSYNLGFNAKRLAELFGEQEVFNDDVINLCHRLNNMYKFLDVLSDEVEAFGEKVRKELENKR